MDLVFTENSELNVTQIEGESEAGIELLDGWVAEPMTVVDSGRIILPSGESVDALAKAARGQGLSIEWADQLADR